MNQFNEFLKQPVHSSHLFRWSHTCLCWLVSAWGIDAVQRHSWSFSPKCCQKSVYRCNLFWNTGEPNETVLLKHSEGWKAAWGQMWLCRATLWLCCNDITSNIVWSQSWPGSLWFCAVLFLVLAYFAFLSLPWHCSLQVFGEKPVLGSVLPCMLSDLHLLLLDHSINPVFIRLIKVFIFNNTRCGIKTPLSCRIFHQCNKSPSTSLFCVSIVRWGHHENKSKSSGLFFLHTLEACLPKAACQCSGRSPMQSESLTEFRRRCAYKPP